MGIHVNNNRKNVALKYSGVGDSKPFPLIFEIDSGAVDRGANPSDDIRVVAISCGEGVPLCALFISEPKGGEVMEVTPDGLLGKIRIRLNVNIKSRTCEDLVSLEKEMHFSCFKAGKGAEGSCTE